MSELLRDCIKKHAGRIDSVNSESVDCVHSAVFPLKQLKTLA